MVLEEDPRPLCIEERRLIDGSIYRHDNRPHENLKNMKTFPKHFHEGSEGNIKESYKGIPGLC